MGGRIRGGKGVTAAIVLLAGVAGATPALADLVPQHLSSTLTQTIGGNVAPNGYFHGPTGAFSTNNGSEQTLIPWVSPPAGTYPNNPTDMTASYITSISGVPAVGGNDSAPDVYAGAEVFTLDNGLGGFDVGATVQSWAIAHAFFQTAPQTTASADIHVINSIAYSVQFTVTNNPYVFRAEGFLPTVSEPVAGNGSTSTTSITHLVHSTMHIEITDGGTTSYDFDSDLPQDTDFTLPEVILNPGATVTVSFASSTEVGFITTINRESLGETVNVQELVRTFPLLTITPEPASLSILAIAATGLLLRRRQK